MMSHSSSAWFREGVTFSKLSRMSMSSTVVNPLAICKHLPIGLVVLGPYMVCERSVNSIYFVFGSVQRLVHSSEDALHYGVVVTVFFA
jgi:hypothetical protein